MRDDSQKVQGVGVPRLHRQNLPVERLRLLQPPRLVVLEPEFKCLLDSHSFARCNPNSLRFKNLRGVETGTVGILNNSDQLESNVRPRSPQKTQKCA